MIPLMFPVAAFFGGGYDVATAALFENDCLSRTFGAGDQQQFVVSWWEKPWSRAYASVGRVFTAYQDASNIVGVYHDGAKYNFQNYVGGVSTWAVDWTARHRDPTSWYHFVCAVDTTQATAADRVRLFCNGVLATPGGGSSYPAQNANLIVNSAVQHVIGDRNPAQGQYLRSYLAQVAFLDGLTITDPDTNGLGELDAVGVWRPVSLASLTFGTNGALLDFANGAAMGADSSGNGNDWTVTGTIPQVVDTPGVGDDQNYCTLNRLDTNSVVTLSNGNRTFLSGSGSSLTRATFPMPTTGKWVVKVTGDVVSDGGFGLANQAQTLVDGGAFDNAWIFRAAMAQKVHASTYPAYGVALSAGQSAYVCYDADAGNLSFIVNGTDYGNAFTGLSGDLFFVAVGNAAATQWTVDFTAAHPSDATYLPLQTANLPEPASAASVTPLTGSFTGNASADGPFVYLGYTPDEAGTCTINGNAITWGTHAFSTAGGFKVITSSASYNASGSNTYSIAVSHPFGGANTTPMTAR